MFLGIDMFSGKYAMTPQYVNTGEATEVMIRDGIYDHLYLSRNPENTVNNINDEWNDDTVINADFNGTLEGGNTGFSLKNTDTILIKKREKGTLDWTTIFAFPVEKIDDFNFVKEYNYGEGETDYEFMIVSSYKGTQTAYEVAECKSDFKGLCIADKTHLYSTDCELSDTTFNQNFTSNVQTLLNNTYPVVISNDDSNYTSGSITALFIKFDENCDVLLGKKGMQYRDEIFKWLCNKKAKILKLQNGTTKLIRITGSPSLTDAGHPELKNISFEFTETGDVNSESDLYKNNLSDVEPNRW